MKIEIVALLCAFGSGAFGAMVGGQVSFICTGVAVLIGTMAALAGADYDVIGNIAFGPVFGPHIAFGGGVAAVAYAARKGDMETGRDIATPVTTIGKPDALLVGAAFGVFGYLFNLFLLNVLDGASYLDTIAMTVIVSSIVVRLMFGRTGIFGKIPADARERGRMSSSSDAVWVAHQSGIAQNVVMGAASGLIASYAMVTIAGVDAELASNVRTFIYGFSAFSLILLQFGQPGPVTHHMTLCGAVVASTIMLNGGSDVTAMLLGIVGGIVGAVLGELSARLFLVHGDTHIDPPAIAIAIVTTAVLGIDALI